MIFGSFFTHDDDSIVLPPPPAVRTRPHRRSEARPRLPRRLEIIILLFSFVFFSNVT